ncbi:MAG: hypothetical protein ACI8XI_001338 [Woeseiaceae bacterium]
MKPIIEVYSKKGCHLCEILIEQLYQLVSDRAEIKINDIEESNYLLEKYKTRIPVVRYQGRTLFQYHLDSFIIEEILNQQ